MVPCELMGYCSVKTITPAPPPVGVPDEATDGVNGPAAVTARMARLAVQKLAAFSTEATGVKPDPVQS